MFNEDDKINNDDNKDIEVVIGNESELDLEISDVQGFMPDLKPTIAEKKKNIVIPVAKSNNKDNSKSVSSKEITDSEEEN